MDFSGTSDFDLMEIGGLIGDYGSTFAYTKIAVLISDEQGRVVADKWRRVTQRGAAESLIAVLDDEQEAVTWLTGRPIHDGDPA